MELFTDFVGTSGGGEILSRWGHYLAGVTWIGLLYYFNFVQTPAFAEVSDSTRSEALRTITWRALWWFRFSALLTFLTGVLILGFQKNLGSEFDTYWTTPAGLRITFGAILGTTMFLNVWLVIWPAQQIAIGSARAVAEGGEADAEAPAAAKRGARASRLNTLFSIPMLLFMGITAHFAGRFGGEIESGTYWGAMVVFLVLWAGFEAVALGYVGGHDSPASKEFFDDHRHTMMWGFGLAVVLYVVCFEILVG